MNILMVTTSVPAGPLEGGCPRVLNFAKELGARHKLHLMVLSQAKLPLRSAEREKELGEFFSSVDMLFSPMAASIGRKIVHRLMFAPGLYKGFLQPDFVREAGGKIMSRCRGDNIDIIYLHGIAASQYVSSKTDVAKIIDLVDSPSRVLTEFSRMEPKLRRQAGLLLEAWSLRRWERKLAFSDIPLITISPEDREIVGAHAEGDKIYVIPNGIDCDYFRPPAEKAYTGRRLVFSGVMSYGPNADAAVYFAKQVLPIITSRHPEVEFCVVGRDPSPEVLALASSPGVLVTGTVEDLRPFLSSADVFVSPLRFGAGMKNKVLSAMAAGLPIVATSKSIEGIDVKPGHDLLVADEAAHFAQSVLDLLLDPKLAERLGHSARQVVKKLYSWRNSAELLERVLISAINNRH